MSAPIVAAPEHLAELRTWLADQWRPGRTLHDTAAPALTAALRQNPVSYACYEQVTLSTASLWWVGEDMVDLLLASAAGVPDDVSFGDLPKMPSTGFIVFAKPWWGLDADNPDRKVQIDAITWGVGNLPARAGAPARRALTISSYRRLDFAMGLTPEELSMSALSGVVADANVLGFVDKPDGVRTYEQDIADPDYATVSVPRGGPASTGSEFGTIVSHIGTERASVLGGEVWLPLGRSDWPISNAVGDTHVWPDDTASDQLLASVKEDRQVLAAFFTLIHQEGIAARTVRPAARPVARRAKRAGVTGPSEVQVITLRSLHRTESKPDGEHEGREWSHRWLVAGHWRWAACGKGRTERRLTYVRPHVKGPEGKPLHVPTRVNAWVR